MSGPFLCRRAVWDETAPPVSDKERQAGEAAPEMLAPARSPSLIAASGHSRRCCAARECPASREAAEPRGTISGSWPRRLGIRG